MLDYIPYVNLQFFVIHFFVNGVCMFLYVMPVIAQQNGMALYFCCLQRICLCRTSMTTQLIPLEDAKSARALGAGG